MNGNSNILARLRRGKARGALCAAVMLVAAQLSAALTPCFANAAEGDTPAAHFVAASHASDGSHTDHSSHSSHSSDASHSSHIHIADVGHASHSSHAGDADDRQHCPHCAGGVPDGGTAHAGQDHACAAVETVDTAPQPPLELAPKLLYLPAIPIAIERPTYVAARASPRRDAPRAPSEVPLNLRHCVFVI